MAFRYPQPDNEVAFEQMCLRYYRKIWNNENLARYGKRGETQNGVDIYDPVCSSPVCAVQCKHHEPTKTLPPAAIMEEVRKAEKSKLPIDQYVIATTAKKTRRAQDTVATLNRRPKTKKRFTVELHFWEDICERLSQFNQVQAWFIVTERHIAVDLLASVLLDPDITSIVSQQLNTVRDDALPVGAFGDIEQLLNDRNFDVARYELDKRPSADRLATLPNDDQYMILRLRGKLALETGDYTLASTLFLEAYDKRPDLDQAKQNRVLAYSLVLDPKKAFDLASEYIAAGLATPAMLCRLIESASTSEQLRTHMRLVESHLDSDEDINTALCHKMTQLGDNAGASEAGARALRIAPDSPHAHFASALSPHNAAITGDWRDRKSNLLSALAHYDAAEKGAREKNFNNLLPEILINRAAIHALLGNATGASADYRAAVAASRQPCVAAARAVSYYLHQEDFANARELLGVLDLRTPEGQFLTVLTQLNSANNDQERLSYLKRLKPLAKEDWPRAVECRLHCVHWALVLKDTKFARSCITKAFLKAHPFQALTALAWIAHRSDNDRDALGYADRALEQRADDAHSAEMRLLAGILTDIGQDVKALDLLDRVAIPGLFNEDAKCLLDCAQRLKRDDLLLRICRELRDTEVDDDRLRRTEIRLLSRYAPEQGLELVDKFIASSAHPAYFVAFKNVLAVRVGKHEAITLHTSLLPGPADLRPSESRLITLLFVTLGRYDDALRFLFSQLRLNFDDEDAHGQFVFYVLTYGHQTSMGEEMDRV